MMNIYLPFFLHLFQPNSNDASMNISIAAQNILFLLTHSTLPEKERSFISRPFDWPLNTLIYALVCTRRSSRKLRKLVQRENRQDCRSDSISSNYASGTELIGNTNMFNGRIICANNWWTGSASWMSARKASESEHNWLVWHLYRRHYCKSEKKTKAQFFPKWCNIPLFCCIIFPCLLPMCNI